MKTHSHGGLDATTCRFITILYKLSLRKFNDRLGLYPTSTMARWFFEISKERAHVD